MDKTYQKNSDINDKPRKQTVKRTIQSDGYVSNKKRKLNDIGLQKGSINIFRSEVKRNPTFANDRLKRLRNQICSEIIPFSTTINSSVLKSSISSSAYPHRNYITSRKESDHGNTNFMSRKINSIKKTNTWHTNTDFIKKNPFEKLVPGNGDQTHFQSFDKTDEQTENYLQQASDLEDQMQLKVKTTISKGDHTVLTSLVDTNSKLLKVKLPVKELHKAREKGTNFSFEEDINIEHFLKQKDEQKKMSVKSKPKFAEVIASTCEYPSRNVCSVNLTSRRVGSLNGSLNISIKNSCLETENSAIKTQNLSDDYENQNSLSMLVNKKLDSECTSELKSNLNLHDNREITKSIANSRLLKMRNHISKNTVTKMPTPPDASNRDFLSCSLENYSNPKSVYSSDSGIQMNNKYNTTKVPQPSRTCTLNLSSDSIATDLMTDKTTKCDKIKELETNHSPSVYKDVGQFEGSMKYWMNYGEIIDSLYEKYFGMEKPRSNISFCCNNNLSEVDNNSSQINQLNFTSDDNETMEWDDDDVTDDLNKFSQTPSRIEENRLKQELYIVVDTNIFLSDLNILKEIVTCGSSGKTKPILYVPWMVLTELDFMKDDKSTAHDLKKKVNDAVTFINKTLLEGGRKLIGQNIFEAEQQKHIGKAPDDKIVSCCIQAQQSNLNVILLSNDVNLKNKLLINEIPALSSAELFKNPLFSNNNTVIENGMEEKLQKISEKMSSCCSYIICECAKYAYGAVWNKMDMLKNPPWRLKICLKIFKKYWSSVFRERLLKHCLKTLEQMDVILKRLELSKNCDKFEEFVQCCLSLCIFFKDMEEHKDMIEQTIQDINFLTNS